jgi:predicted DNA binding protein
MSVSATLSIRVDQFEFGEILAVDGVDRIELFQIASLASPGSPYCWVEGAQIAVFESAVRADPRVEAIVQVDTLENRRLYRIELKHPENGFLGLLSAHELIVERGYCRDQTWTFRIRAVQVEMLSAFQAACLEQGVRFDVERVSTELLAHEWEYDLTQKQREALELAFNEGYFRVPRETSLTSLESRIDISRQAFSRRLSRGLHTLLQNTLFRDQQ